MTDQQIINENCGTPPQRDKLEYLVWLSEKKADFYERNRTAGIDPDGHRRLAALAKQKLKELTNE